MKRVKAAGGATRTRSRDRRRAAGRRARAIAGRLKLRGAAARDEAQATVQRITGELADLALTAMREAGDVIRNGKRAVRRATGQRKGRLRRALDDLATIIERTTQVVTQTRSRLGGVMPDSSSRLVSLHDPHARPIRKGRLGIPVEFGYKAQIVDNDDGVILDHNVEIGNPADAPQLAPAIERIKRRTGRAPRAVTADRGYGEAKVEDALHELGVESVAIPRKAKPSAARREFEHRRAFREKVKWRTGCEGRINPIKRSYGWNRTELIGIQGARIWCGHGVFAHNLVKIGHSAPETSIRNHPTKIDYQPEPSKHPHARSPIQRRIVLQGEVASPSSLRLNFEPLVDLAGLSYRNCHLKDVFEARRPHRPTQREMKIRELGKAATRRSAPQYGSDTAPSG